MRILGLIPARGGSKGIPHKNKKLLNSKPLLQYTIEAALGSKLLTSVVFTSEDETLMRLASEIGAEVPFKRPYELATDSASSLDVVQHAIKALSEKGQDFDAVCLLQVTNPFRESKMIDAAIERFIEHGTHSLVSVLKVPHEYNPHWVFEASEDQTLKIATGDSEIIKRRQELPDAFIRDGAIYLTRTEVLINQNSLYGKTISYIESDATRHVNIDTPKDWQLAEELVTKLGY